MQLARHIVCVQELFKFLHEYIFEISLTLWSVHLFWTSNNTFVYRGSCQVRKWHSNCASPTSSNCRHSVALRAQSFCCSRVPIALYAERGIQNLHNKISIIKEVGGKRNENKRFRKEHANKAQKCRKESLTRFRFDKAKGKARNKLRVWRQNGPKIKPNWTGTEPREGQDLGRGGVAEIKAKCVAQR